MKSLFFSLKSRNKSLQIKAIILRFLSVRIMFVNTFLWNFHSKSSFQSNSFLFVQKLLVSLLPANQVFDFFSRCLNALSARKCEKSKSQNLFLSAVLYFSILSVLSCRSRKAKSQKSFPLKSARNCPLEKVVRSQKSVKTEKSVYVE